MEFKLHPIQLRFVAVRELYIRTFYPPAVSAKYSPATSNLQANAAPLDPQTNVVQIGLHFRSGRETDPTDEDLASMKASQEQPFRVVVQIVAEFFVDTNKFPAEKVPAWAKINAPAILFPFLREQVFALTARCGFNPLILPMIHLPTTPREKESVPIPQETVEASVESEVPLQTP